MLYELPGQSYQSGFLDEETGTGVTVVVSVFSFSSGTSCTTGCLSPDTSVALAGWSGEAAVVSVEACICPFRFEETALCAWAV